MSFFSLENAFSTEGEVAQKKQLYVLILDNDKAYQRILSYHLIEKKLKVKIVDSIEKFRIEFNNEKPDCIICDMVLPDGTGYAVVQLVRQTDLLIPILVVSSSSQSIDRELVFNAGADVVLSKPIQINELLAVIKRFQERILASLDLRLAHVEMLTLNKYDSWRLLKNESLIISPNGKCLQLTTAEFDFLAFLSLSEHEVSRINIAQHFKSLRSHKDDHLKDGALNTMICRLRKRWSNVNASLLPIQSIRGTGYCFNHPGGITLIIDRRDDHFNRVILDHINQTLSNKDNGVLSDSDREMGKKLYRIIKMAVPSYFMNRAAQFCDLMMDNADSKFAYEQLYHSDYVSKQFLIVMFHFSRFLLESPKEHLHWLINLLDCNELTDSQLHKSGLDIHENTKVGEIVLFLTQICRYLEGYFHSSQLREQTKTELELMNLQENLVRLSVELVEIEREWTIKYNPM
jgi:DNA-binding response OmpR family regulator